jgi:two-component system response regulator FixJ
MTSDGTVYIVEDDAAARRSVQHLLEAAGFIAIAYESAPAFLEAAAAQLSPGCLLLDLRLPEMSGLDLQARLNEQGQHLPVIVMTAFGDVQSAVRALKAGAVDFIEKPFNDERLFEAIRTAQVGLVRSARERDIDDAAERIAALSPREREVLGALVAGQSNKVIAHELGISVRTVEVHRARMLDRLRAHTLAEAVRLMVMSALA